MKHKVKKLSKDKRFFDHYTYCVEFYLHQLTVVRIGIDQVDRILQLRKDLSQNRFFGSWAHKGRPITDKTKQDLVSFSEFLDTVSDYKLTVSSDKGFFYTNKLEDADVLLKQSGVEYVLTREAVVDRPPNTIRILKAKHNFRTYFKTQSITLENKQRLEQFCQRDDLRIGPGLSEWFTRYESSKYVADNYFIDHNDTSILTMLTLASGIKIKKTVAIIRDK